LSTPWKQGVASSELTRRQPARWAKEYRVIGGQPFTIIPPLEHIYRELVGVRYVMRSTLWPVSVLAGSTR
jgi:hypothetical protein